jgi:hypothetical protein
MAADWIWPQIEPFLKSHNGPIYFTGHSYGGSVSGIFACFCASSTHRENPFFLTVTHPFLQCLRTPHFRCDETLYTFVNDDDIIPTLSIGNCYAYLHETFPLLSILPDSWLIEYLEDVGFGLRNCGFHGTGSGGSRV